VNNHFIKLASILCIALLLIIISEWLVAHLAQQQLLASNTVKTEQSQPDEMPSVDLSQEPEESYADLVDRPLFMSGRRAVPETESSAPAQIAGAMPANFDWQLNGVYTKDKRLFALFSHAKVKLPKAKDNFRKLSTDELLDGWQITEIKLDRVKLKQGANEKELPLRKPKPKEAPQAAPDGNPAPDAPPENGEPAPVSEENALEAPIEEQPLPEPESEPTEAPEGAFEN
jgi:hypothetical protein